IEKKNKDLKNKIQKLMPFSLFPEHESNLSSPALVTCLGKRLDFAITIDNGVMHMLSLSKVPMISLFGPTNAEKFAPKYEKSIVLDSKEIHNTTNMSALTVEDVLQAAKQHLNFSY
ncbi:MAG: ADP-heptose--LPS heptosyltransferase, partial [Pelagibacteraceae bacterium]